MELHPNNTGKLNKRQGSRLTPGQVDARYIENLKGLQATASRSGNSRVVQALTALLQKRSNSR